MPGKYFVCLSRWRPLCFPGSRSVSMAKDPLAEAGLYFDEVSGLQILDPEVRQKSLELKEECKIFIDGKFHQTSGVRCAVAISV